MLDIYRTKGEAMGVKTDPPIKAYKGKIPIYGENHFVDFLGVTEGAMFLVECKHTNGGTLPVDRKAGVTRKQIQNMAKWSDFGASCWVLWHSERHGYFMVPSADLFLAFVNNEPSLYPKEDWLCGTHEHSSGELLPDFIEFLP